MCVFILHACDSWNWVHLLCWTSNWEVWCKMNHAPPVTMNDRDCDRDLVPPFPPFGAHLLKGLNSGRWAEQRAWLLVVNPPKLPAIAS